MEIYEMTAGHALWERTADFALRCSWRAGGALAELMRSGGIGERERVFAAFEGDVPAGFCTLAEKDELPARYDFTPFIGFMFVDERFRGQRLSERLIRRAEECARSMGREKLYVMSGERGLYEKYGFEPIGDYETIYGTTDRLFVKDI